MVNKNGILNESIYDFYRLYDKAGNKKIVNKIIDYYLDKIVKYGEGSLTKNEKDLLNKAKINRLPEEKISYKRNKLTGDIELGSDGKPIKLDTDDDVVPGIPFITSKGRGFKKEDKLEARCYWDIDNNVKYYYVFSPLNINDKNAYGLIIWKTISNNERPLGAFIVPKNELDLPPNELWDRLNTKYDKGIILSKEMYNKFMLFYDLYKNDKKKADILSLNNLYMELVNYPN